MRLACLLCIKTPPTARECWPCLSKTRLPVLIHASGALMVRSCPFPSLSVPSTMRIVLLAIWKGSLRISLSRCRRRKNCGRARSSFAPCSSLPPMLSLPCERVCSSIATKALWRCLAAPGSRSWASLPRASRQSISLMGAIHWKRRWKRSNWPCKENRNLLSGVTFVMMAHLLRLWSR